MFLVSCSLLKRCPGDGFEAAVESWRRLSVVLRELDSGRDVWSDNMLLDPPTGGAHCDKVRNKRKRL